MDKLNIYQIEQQYITLANQIIEADGVLDDELSEALQINQDQLEEKGRSYGYVIKKLDGECDIIDLEIKRLTALKKSRVNTATRLKETIKTAMDLYEIDKIETPTLKISFIKSKAVIIEDLEKIERDFIITKVTKQADKKAIKTAIEDGYDVEGAILQENRNISIK